MDLICKSTNREKIGKVHPIQAMEPDLRPGEMDQDWSNIKRSNSFDYQSNQYQT